MATADKAAADKAARDAQERAKAHQEKEAAEAKKEAQETRSLAQRAEGGDKLTTLELGLVTGNVKRQAKAPGGLRLRSGGSRIEQRFSDGKRVSYEPTPEHSAAAHLHGWVRHDISAPHKLTLKDYKAALEAAANPRPPSEEERNRGERSHYRPHVPALSPHQPQARKES